MESIASIYHRSWQAASTAESAATPLVLVHGLFGSLENLGMITRLLKDEFHIYGVDLPNHGRSNHVNDISLQSMAEAMLIWMDANGLVQADLVGHSLGGKVCMEFALRYPDRVNRLIVADIAPVTYPRRHDDVFEAFRAVDLSEVKHRADADKLMAPYVPLESTRSFLLNNLKKSTDAGAANAWYWRLNVEGLERDYHKLIQGNTTVSPAFEKPVLFIKGEHSDYILPSHQEAILALFPNASVRVISGTEHWLHAEKPDVFASIVRRFLLQDKGTSS